MSERKPMKIRHDTFIDGRPVTIIREGSKEIEIPRGMDKVDPEGLRPDRTQDRSRVKRPVKGR